MIKYITKVEILVTNEVGKKNWSVITDFFEDENPINARNKAIARIKSLSAFYLDELSEDIKFNTMDEARQKNFKNFNMFFPELIFVCKDGWQNKIYGDIDEVIEGLKEEAIHYSRHINPPKMTNIINAEGETIEVLESNIEFFLN